MIQSLQLKNFGPVQDLDWNKLGSINLILGENGSGKTFLLNPSFPLI